MAHPLDTQVAKRLADANPTIKEAVITSKVDEALAKRKQLALDALQSINAYQKKLDDQKPDALYDADGQPVTTGFNTAQNAERKKWKDEIKRLEEALANALGEKADWSGLEK